MLKSPTGRRTYIFVGLLGIRFFAFVALFLCQVVISSSFQWAHAGRDTLYGRILTEHSFQISGLKIMTLCRKSNRSFLSCTRNVSTVEQQLSRTYSWATYLWPRGLGLRRKSVEVSAWRHGKETGETYYYRRPFCRVPFPLPRPTPAVCFYSSPLCRPTGGAESLISL